MFVDEIPGPIEKLITEGKDGSDECWPDPVAVQVTEDKRLPEEKEALRRLEQAIDAEDRYGDEEWEGVTVGWEWPRPEDTVPLKEHEGSLFYSADDVAEIRQSSSQLQALAFFAGIAVGLSIAGVAAAIHLG